MKRFDFKLESLLGYRGYLEKRARQKTAEALRNVKASGEMIEQLKKKYSECRLDLEDAASEGVSAGKFRHYQNYLDSVESGIEEETSRKAHLDKVLGDKMSEMKSRRVDKKVIEQLKEKKVAEYMDELRKFEQDTLDEVASLRKAREINDDSSF
ncbi:MAG: flagellar export protein FliJ [Desulfobacteraceae bacterium]